jgi:hypothetical protein
MWSMIDQAEWLWTKRKPDLNLAEQQYGLRPGRSQGNYAKIDADEAGSHEQRSSTGYCKNDGNTSQPVGSQEAQIVMIFFRQVKHDSGKTGIMPGRSGTLI